MSHNEPRSTGFGASVGRSPIGEDRCGRAILMIVLSSLSFGLVGIMVRLAGDVPVYEKVFFRSIVMLPVAAAFGARSGAKLFTWDGNTKWLVLRGIFGTVAMTLYFYAIEGLTLADATVLNKLSPFFVVVLAAVFLHEKLSKYVVPVLAIAFVGAALVIKPELELSPGPALAGLFSAIGSAAAYTVVRSLKGREAPFKIVFYFAMVSTLAMIPPMLVHAVVPTWQQLLALVGAGVFATTGQLSLTIGYQLAPASRISIYVYAHVIFAGILAYLFFSEVPDALSIVGGALVIGAAVLNYRLLHREPARPTVSC
ncbi:MAG: EamA family transporter [Candidatus Eisenbacteria bacterium]|nr:EamA family transporter [Candidatus Eisenbacteria bacterium]